PADRGRADVDAAAERVADLDAEIGTVRVDDVAVPDDLAGDVLDRVARDRKADARRGAAELGIGRAQRRDPDHAAGDVDQRAAGIAGVDRGARLDHVRKRDAAAFRLGAVERADDSLGDARGEAEGIADRHHDVTDLELRRVGERRRPQLAAVHLDDGEIVLRERADELRRQLLAGRRGDGEAREAADDVVVGDDVAVRVEDDARAEPRWGADLDDRRRHLPEDGDERVLQARDAGGHAERRRGGARAGGGRRGAGGARAR